MLQLKKYFTENLLDQLAAAGFLAFKVTEALRLPASAHFRSFRVLSGQWMSWC